MSKTKIRYVVTVKGSAYLHYQRTCPADVREAVGRRRWDISLKTAVLREAEVLARKHAVKHDEEIASHRAAAARKAAPDPMQSASSAERERVGDSGGVSSHLTYLERRVRDAMHLESEAETIREWAGRDGPALEMVDPEEDQIRLATVEAEASAIRAMIDREAPLVRHLESAGVMVAATLMDAVEAPVPVVASVVITTLTDALHSWERVRKPRMPQLFRKAVEIFNEMHGVALPLAEIGRQHVREFRDHLAAMDVSYETSIGRWRCVATILRHAASEDMIDTSPMAGREYVARKQKASDARKKKRLTFSVPQIELLFKLANELEASREHRDVDTGWFIRLLLFTGARGEELAQLHARDVTTINGVACIRIHDEGANNIKNNASLRDTPLHSELLKMGFLKFVESRKGAPRIFSSLKPDGKGRIYSAMSARLCRLFRKNGIKDSRIVPHSARHTLTDCLRMAGVPAEGQDDIIGHASRGRETSDRYGDQQVVVLAGYVERVNLFDMNRQVREFVED